MRIEDIPQNVLSDGDSIGFRHFDVDNGVYVGFWAHEDSRMGSHHSVHILTTTQGYVLADPTDPVQRALAPLATVKDGKMIDPYGHVLVIQTRDLYDARKDRERRRNSRDLPGMGSRKGEVINEEVQREIGGAPLMTLGEHRKAEAEGMISITPQQNRSEGGEPPPSDPPAAAETGGPGY